MKLNFLLLIVAVLWLACSAVFFLLRFAGTGMIPLSMPIGTLVLGAAFLAAYLRIRKLTADRGRKK